MNYLKKIVPIVTCVICVILILTITLKQTNKITLNEVNPTAIVVGEAFNLFEEKSTMSLYGKGFQVGDVIYLNDMPQESAVGDSGWMTCFVNPEVYQQEGIIQVQVKRVNEKNRIVKKSNKLKIEVSSK